MFVVFARGAVVFRAQVTNCMRTWYRCVRGHDDTVSCTLSLHDALPIFLQEGEADRVRGHDRLGVLDEVAELRIAVLTQDRKSTRLNSSHVASSYAVFCLQKKSSSRYLASNILRSRVNRNCPSLSDVADI